MGKFVEPEKERKELRDGSAMAIFAKEVSPNQKKQRAFEIEFCPFCGKSTAPKGALPLVERLVRDPLSKLLNRAHLAGRPREPVRRWSTSSYLSCARRKST